MNRFLVAGVVLSLAALAGCSQNNKAEVREQVQGMRQQIGAAAQDAERAANNAALAGKVKSALETRKGLERTKINVDAQGATVTLKGDVSSREQAELAERVATETEGVQSVVNQLMLRIPAKSAAPAVPPAPAAPAEQQGPPAGAMPSTGSGH